MSAAKRSDNKSYRRFKSSELLDGKNMVEILHNGGIYRLSLTRQNKLILTK